MSWNSKVWYHVHKSVPLVPILSHFTPTYPLFNINFNSTSHMCQVLPIASGFMAVTLYHLCFPCMHSTCLVHLIILICIILIIHYDNFTVLIRNHRTPCYVTSTCNTVMCSCGLNSEECQRKYSHAPTSTDSLSAVY